MTARKTPVGRATDPIIEIGTPKRYEFHVDQFVKQLPEMIEDTGEPADSAGIFVYIGEFLTPVD